MATTIIIKLDDQIQGSWDVDSSDLELSCGMIPKGARKGEGLGKDWRLSSDMYGIQCNASIEGLDEYENRMLDICKQMVELARQLEEIDRHCVVHHNTSQLIDQAKKNGGLE